MSENKPPRELPAPVRLVTNALKAVKGSNTQQLVEDFTSEMTLVAEGLCDDQAKLRNEVSDLRREADRRVQKLEAAADALESTAHEEAADTQRRLADIGRRLDAQDRRLAAIEAQLSAMAEEKKKKAEHGLMPALRQLTVLVAILGAAMIIVQVLRLFE